MRALTVGICLILTEQRLALHSRSSFLAFLEKLLEPEAVSLLDLPGALGALSRSHGLHTPFELAAATRVF